MSKKPVLLITRNMPHAVEARALAGYDARLNRDDIKFDADSLIAAADGADALLLCNEALTRETVARLPGSVKITALFTAGHDHVDLAAAKERGMIVTNAPDALTDAVADLTLLLLLGAARRAGCGDGGWGYFGVVERSADVPDVIT